MMRCSIHHFGAFVEKGATQSGNLLNAFIQRWTEADMKDFGDRVVRVCMGKKMGKVSNQAGKPPGVSQARCAPPPHGISFARFGGEQIPAIASPRPE